MTNKHTLRRLATVAAALTFTLTMSAQLKQFTLEDLNFGGKNYAQMRPASKSLAWWGDRLVRTDKDQCWEVDKRRGTERALLSTSDLGEDGKDLQLSRASFPYEGKTQVMLSDGKSLRLIDWKKHQTVLHYNIEGAVARSWSKESKALAYVKDNQLYVATADGTVKQLTTDGSREIVYGQAVHRNEFGIDGGLFWSEDGQRLAFYRMDQTMVADYPQVNTFERCATYEPDKYPMAGETSHKVTVGVYDLSTGNTLYLKAGDPTDRYFTNIAWAPDAQTVYMFELNRDQNDCQLVAYNASTGDKLRTLYEETDAKYVEPQHPIAFLPWDHSQFLLQSRKDGYNHLYLFNTDGKQLSQLTSGSWEVLSLVGFNEQERCAIIESNELSPLQRNTFLVDMLNGGHRTLIDETDQGWHYPTLSASGKYVVDYYQTPDTPRNISLNNTVNGNRLRLLTADNPWEGYAIPQYESGTIKAADGVTDLYYRMVKPADFDPTKKYPTVVYVYGGPHAHCVEASWHYGSRSWETYMAQKGYIIFILDNRGSENRGKDFEQATFRQLGVVEMEDQMRGVDFLRTLPYVDADRLGVHGWSFGGFMTTSLMTTYPDVFKVGVAGGPVIDWKWYEVMYGERYMDTPQANPEGYEKTSLLAKAKNLKGKLQIIIGMNDPTVVPQHALQFLNACAEAGTQPDFYVYPGEGHNMMGHKSVHLHERITQYFEDYLK